MEHRHRHLPPETMRGINRPPEAHVMSVIAVTAPRGEGCCEDDRVRLVTTYYSLEGAVLAEQDPQQSDLDTLTNEVSRRMRLQGATA